MLEVDGLFYLFILNFRWKWSSIICRYWLNRLKYITYEELTPSAVSPRMCLISEIHYLWGIDTVQIISLENDFLGRCKRYITYEELTQIPSDKLLCHDKRYITYKELTLILLWIFTGSSYLTEYTLPIRNWHCVKFINWYSHNESWYTLPIRNWHKETVTLSCLIYWTYTTYT